MGKVTDEVKDAALTFQEKYGIPASVIIAQWALESGWGKSVSGKNNYGGITAKVTGAKFPLIPGTPLEPATLVPTWEVVNGKKVKCSRWFKDFATVEDYFEAHSRLLALGKPYANARAKLKGKNPADDFADALTGVYATDPNYGKTLKSIMKGSDLYKYNDYARIRRG